MSAMDLFENRLATTSGGVHLFILAEEIREDPAGRSRQALSGDHNQRTSQDEMRGLREDLRRLEGGWSPNDDDLAGSPLLEEWGVAFLPDELLWRVMGDPYDATRDLPGVVDGETMCTMQVLAIDEEFTWIRDRRGFYRLGRSRA